MFLNILSIFLLMSAGWVLRRRGLVDDAFTRRLSFVLVNVFYPCLIVNALLSRFTLASLAENGLMPVGVFAVKITGWLAGAVFLRLWKSPRPDTGRTFHFVCAVNNYSFLPIMLALPLWGGEAVALIAFGALGAEVFLWTLGLRTLAGRATGSVFRQLLSTPMVALFAAGAALALRHFLPLGHLPGGFRDAGGMVLSTFKTAGAATIPVSALICGARIGAADIRACLSRPVWMFCALRLALVPALCVGFIFLLPLPSELARNVLMLIAIQPAAMASVSLSEVYGGDPGFAAAAVFLSHLLCLATIPLWCALLGLG